MSVVRPFSEDCHKTRQRLLAAMREKKAKAEAFNEVKHLFGSAMFSRRLQDSIAADRAAETAWQAMLAACDNETSRIDLPSGTRVIIHAKADPLAVETTFDILNGEIPAEDLEGLDIVRFEGERSGRTTEVPQSDGSTDCREVRGDYRVIDDGRTIIRDCFPHDFRTIEHEIGHHVFHKLSPDQQKQWKTLWGELKRRGKLPTDYAGKNENEGFAELYEHFRNRLPLTDEAHEAIARFVRPNPQSAEIHGEGKDECRLKRPFSTGTTILCHQKRHGISSAPRPTLKAGSSMKFGCGLNQNLMKRQLSGPTWLC